jgi:hypothetical protein
MSTLLKAYLMNTDNPFLMFKCLYEDIQKGYKDELKPSEQRLLEEEHGWKDKLEQKTPKKKHPKKTGKPPLSPRKKSGKEKYGYAPKQTAIPFFEDAIEDTENDDLEEAYNEMKELRRRMMGEKTGIGQDIFAVKLKIPTTTRENDEYKDSPYSAYTREANLRTLKTHLNKIKTAVIKNLQKENPAAVERLTNAIDTWVENIPELIEDIELTPLRQQDIQEMYGAGVSTPARRRNIGMPRHIDLETTIDSVDKWIRKLSEYDENINIFLTHSERAKENIVRKFFKSGKIDELEDILEGKLTLKGLPDDDRARRLQALFNRIKRNLEQQRPDGTLLEQLDKAYKEHHKVSRLKQDERQRKKKFFQDIKRRLPPSRVIREKAKKRKQKEIDRKIQEEEEEEEVSEAMGQLFGEEGKWESQI